MSVKAALDDAARRMTDRAALVATFPLRGSGTQLPRRHVLPSGSRMPEFNQPHKHSHSGPIEPTSHGLIGPPVATARANRLRRAGLFPERNRRRFVETVGQYALDGMDATVFTNDAIKAMFTAEDFERLVKAVRQQVLPSLSETCSDWLSDSDGGQTPEDDASPLLEFLEALKSQFADEPSVVRDIDWEIGTVWEWVADNEPEEAATDETEHRELASEPAPYLPQARRSIFDDIDADEEVDTVPQVPLRSNVN